MRVFFMRLLLAAAGMVVVIVVVIVRAMRLGGGFSFLGGLIEMGEVVDLSRRCKAQSTHHHTFWACGEVLQTPMSQSGGFLAADSHFGVQSNNNH